MNYVIKEETLLNIGLAIERLTGEYDTPHSVESFAQKISEAASKGSTEIVINRDRRTHGPFSVKYVTPHNVQNTLTSVTSAHFNALIGSQITFDNVSSIEVLSDDCQENLTGLNYLVTNITPVILTIN